MKWQRNTTQMKEQNRNTEVQTSEEKIGKLPKKGIQNNNSKDDQKPWKQNARINKDLEELKHKYTETTQLLKLKIL